MSETAISSHTVAVTTAGIEFTAASSQPDSPSSLEKTPDRSASLLLTLETESDDQLSPAKRRRTEDTSRIWGEIEKDIELSGYGELEAVGPLGSLDPPPQRPELGLVAECEEHTPAQAQAPFSDYCYYGCEASDINAGEDIVDQDLGGLLDFGKEETEDDTVCFGMIDDLPVQLCATGLTPGPVAVELGSHGTIVLQDDFSLLGRLENQTARILGVLSSDKEVRLQVLCNVKKGLTTPRKRKAAAIGSQPIVSLSIIIYGPRRLFEKIGDFLDAYRIYLQDPKGCDQNVRYRNPHRLSGLDRDAPMTIERELEQMGYRCETIPASFDPLADLRHEEDLLQTDAPPRIATSLFKHQKQALTFMLRRERGWRLQGSPEDVWRQGYNERGAPIYTNTITGDSQGIAPSPFRGGILADQMGLGKSLSMISLIASDCDVRPRDTGTGKGSPSHSASLYTTKATLIVVPPSLIHTWEVQLDRHLQPGALRWARHHGRNRIHDRSQLDQCDIVLTSYQTIVSEWKKHRVDASSFIFSVQWHRVALDEAHRVRSRNTQTALAVCELDASRRWAMTGTPIQNGLTDIVALMKFLRVYPYSDPEAFDVDFMQLLKISADESIARLKALFKCIVLRRSSSTIQLPERTDQIHYLDFTPNERAKYEEVRAYTVAMLDKALNTGGSRGVSHLTALQQINALRIICNLGMLAPSRPDQNLERTETLANESWDAGSAQAAFNTIAALGQAICTKCGTEVSMAEPENVDSKAQYPPHLSRCIRLICSSCHQKLAKNKSSPFWCGHSPPCITAAISSIPTVENPEDLGISDIGVQSTKPSKIRALVEDLQRFNDTKSVVFSFWTSTLDIIQRALNEALIPCVRFDGKVSSKNRISALDSFSHDPTVKVILFTTSCGADGLDLTAGSRAYLMEPHWNPTVEDQALARVHRMGQCRPVTTVRFIMKDSYEQHVVKVQKKKQVLSELLLSQKPRCDSGHKKGLFLHLRSLLT